MTKLASRLLLPCLCYSLLYYSFNVAKVVILHKEINLVHNFVGIFISLRGTDLSVGVWFLPLLFLSEVLVYPVILQQKKRQIAIMLVVLGIGFIYAWKVHQVLPWGLDVVPIAAFFTWLGHLYRELTFGKPVHYSKWSLFFAMTVLLLGINISTVIWNDKIIDASVDMYSMTYGNPVLYLTAAVSGISFIIVLCRDILEKHDIKLMSIIGQNTLHIYCIHGLVIIIIREIKERHLGSDVFSVIPEQILISITVLTICIGLILCAKSVNGKSNGPDSHSQDYSCIR